MIKVICIKDSIKHDITDDIHFTENSSKLGCSTDDLFPKLGVEYNVTAIKNGLTLQGTGNSFWYMLKETGDLIHHSSLFVISPSSIRDCKLNELLFD